MTNIIELIIISHHVKKCSKIEGKKKGIITLLTSLKIYFAFTPIYIYVSYFQTLLT